MWAQSECEYDLDKGLMLAPVLNLEGHSSQPGPLSPVHCPCGGTVLETGVGANEFVLLLIKLLAMILEGRGD
jgi:hypothetical protein